MKKPLLLSAFLILACSSDYEILCVDEVSLSTLPATNITRTSATLSGVISTASINCDTVSTQRQGIVYSRQRQPVIGDFEINLDVDGVSINTTLENGGSLSSVAIDCSDPLNNSSCSGYASAYLSQECGLTQLYSEECPNYWDAYDDLQCDENPQYAPFCPSYRHEDNIAYYSEEEDYGYTEEDMWYDEEYDEWLDPNDPCYQNGCENMTDADWYALDTEQFGQEQVDEWFGTDISFSDDGMVEFDSTLITSYEDVDVMMDEWDVQQDQQRQDEMLLDEFLFQEIFLVEDYSEPETFIEFETIEQLEEWFEEETEQMEEEIARIEEPEEEFIEEIFEEEAVEEIFEAQERIVEAEVEEERIEREEAPEEFEENFVEEFQLVEREEAEGKSSISRDVALRVVASTIVTANQSVSGTTAGNSVHSSGNSVAAGNSASSSSSSGISTSSSPSMSDQFASATAQNNQVGRLSFPRERMTETERC